MMSPVVVIKGCPRGDWCSIAMCPKGVYDICPGGL